MKTFFRTFFLIILWVLAVPAGAGACIMLLWNAILPDVAGISAISFWQGTGLFFLGQFLSAGFFIGLFLLGAVFRFSGHHRHLHDRWHRMTDEERRDFIERRRQWFEMSHDSFRRNGSGNGQEGE